MKSSYLTAGITLKRLLRLVSRNRISLKPPYLFRLIFLFQSALWSSLFAFIEHNRFSKKLNSLPIPSQPVFIIGHWRTGSTFLHKLISLDPDFVAPTLFDVAEPDSLLSSYNYYKPVMKVMISKTRPMDKVVIGMNEPQEDEYAIYRLIDCSPLERLVFPKSKKYFLTDLLEYNSDIENTNNWKDGISLFHKKIFLKYQRKIVSKNPFNSFRIKEILAIFPDAKFIHIVRHPYNVVPSTVHMWNIVQNQNVLNENAVKPTVSEVSSVLKSMLERIESDKVFIPEGKFAEIHYEQLEGNCIEEIIKLYSKLELNFSNIFRKRLEDYIGKVKDFERNKFILDEKDKKTISEILKKQMINHGYQP